MYTLCICTLDTDRRMALCLSVTGRDMILDMSDVLMYTLCICTLDTDRRMVLCLSVTGRHTRRQYLRHGQPGQPGSGQGRS